MFIDALGYLMLAAACVLALALIVMVGRRMNRSDWIGTAIGLFWFVWLYGPLLIAAIGSLIIVTVAAFELDALEFVLFIWTMAMVVSCVAAPIGWSAKRARDRGLARRLLHHLERGVRLNVPMTPWLRALALNERRPFRQIILDLADRLDGGEPLSSALPSVAPLLDRRVADFLCSADSAGQLPAMLSAIADQQVCDDRQQARRQGPTAEWIAATCGVVFLMQIVLAVFITPKLEKLSEDFGSSAGALHLLGGTDDSYNWLILRVVVGLGLVSACVGIILHPVRRADSLWGVFRDWLASVPPMRWVDWNLGLSDACLLLAQTSRARVPLAVASRQAAFLPMNRPLRDQLERWSEVQSQGFQPAAAARVARLPEYLAAMLALAQDSHALPQAFSMLAKHYGERARRTLQAMRLTVVSVAYILIALNVAMIALGLFQMLVGLMWACVLQSLAY
jgi:type II secretory pathway component PulF